MALPLRVRLVGEFPSTSTVKSPQIRVLGIVTLQKPTVPEGPVTLKVILLFGWSKVEFKTVEFVSVSTR